MAVLAGQDGGRCAERHAHAGARLEYTVLGHAADVLRSDEERRDDLGAGDVDLLAGAHALAARHGGDAPGCGGVGAEELGGEGAVLQGGLAGSPAVAAAGGREVEGVQIRALPVGIGPGLAERRDGDHHQVGVAGGERRVVETPVAHAPGLVVLDEHVGPRHEVEQLLALLGCADVQGDAALVRVEEEEEAALLRVRVVSREGTPTTADVAIGGLDLDDLRSVVAEELGAEGRRNPAAELHHSNTCQCVVGHDRCSPRKGRTSSIVPTGQEPDPSCSTVSRFR